MAVRNYHIEHSSSILGIQLEIALLGFGVVEIETRIQNSRKEVLVSAGMVGKKGSSRHCRKHGGSCLLILF